MQVESEMTPPTFEEVESYFYKMLSGDGVPEDKAKFHAIGLTRKFISYNQFHGWTVKTGNKRIPMKDWKAACRTWFRNMEKYNKVLYIQITSAKIFNDGK